MPWPTASDLEKALKEAGVPLPLSSTSTSALAEAIERWEAQTGWLPFVALDTATQIEYPLDDHDRGTRLVDLRAGIPTGVTAPTLTLDDAALVAGYEEDYQLWPLDAARRGKPYQYVRLSYHRKGLLKVTAKWGFCPTADIPEIAFQAVLAQAALIIAEPALAKASTGDATSGRNLQSVEEGDVKLVFGTSAAERMAAITSWQQQWASAVNLLKRRTL